MRNSLFTRLFRVQSNALKTRLDTVTHNLTLGIQQQVEHIHALFKEQEQYKAISLAYKDSNKVSYLRVRNWFLNASFSFLSQKLAMEAFTRYKAVSQEVSGDLRCRFLGGGGYT